MKTFPKKKSCRRILIIEPNRNLRDALGHLLEARKYTVEYARDERTALEALMRDALPDVILLELELKSASGWRFLAFQKTSQQLAKIPTLVFSGKSRDPEIELLDSLDRICEGEFPETLKGEVRSPLLHLPTRLKTAAAPLQKPIRSTG